MINNTFIPKAVSVTAAKAAKVAAHAAVLQPYSITKLIQFAQHPDAKAFTGSMQINFGKPILLEGWNSVNSANAGYTAKYLKNMASEDTRVQLVITEGFNSINTNGDSVISKDYTIPLVVSGSSFFGNSKAPHDDLLVTSSAFELNNLDQNKAYTLVFYSSRQEKRDDNKETQFTVTGRNNKTATVNSANNQNLVSVKNIKPDKSGTIKVEVTAGPRNNNDKGYYYLNALILEVE